MASRAVTNTVRFSVPVDGARAGENTIAFRFNGTDGFSHGFRVLEFNLLRNGAGQLPASDFERDDPAAWTAPRPDAADVEAGRDLWRARGVLLESALSDATLRASCADCHTADGRDLKYFNYSNEAIETRARFHGLSAADAERIASYVRTRDVPAPSRAAPWNPPYQPGPGLDDAPVLEWAAGAGLEWVLDEDADMLPHLFPNGTSPAAVAEGRVHAPHAQRARDADLAPAAGLERLAARGPSARRVRRRLARAAPGRRARARHRGAGERRGHEHSHRSVAHPPRPIS